MTVDELQVIITANTAQLTTAMSGATGQINRLQSQTNSASTRMQKAFSGVGKVAMVAGAAIAAGFGAALVMGIKGVTEGEDAIAQLDAVLKSTGGSAGVMRKDLLDVADQMQKTTKFTQEDTLAAESLLLTFTNIGSKTFPAATRAAADMATALGTDMAGQSIALGKALNDPTKGITALTRVGVTFTDEQKKSIKAMQESGDMAGAQTIILKELEKEFGGSAEAAGKTFSGQLEILKNAFGEVTEALALQFMPYLQKFMDWIIAHMPQIEEIFNKVFDVISTAVKTLVGALVGVSTWISENQALVTNIAIVLGSFAVAWGVVAGALALYNIVTGIATAVQAAFAATLFATTIPIWVVIAAIGAIIAIGVLLYKNWDTVKAVTIAVWTSIKIFFSTVFEGIKSTVSSAVNAINSTVTSVWNGIKSVTSSVFNGIKGVISSVWNGIKSTVTSVANGISSTITSVWNGIKSTTSSVFNAVKNSIMTPINAAKDGVKNAIDAIKGFFDNLTLKFPSIKLPHFSLVGNFSLAPPSVPHLGVDWYANGGVFNKASVIGVGEHGREAVMPLEHNTGWIDELANKLNGKSNNNNKGITQNVIINSPTALSPSETARMNKKALQQFAFNM